jgi:hypothetical protein
MATAGKPFVIALEEHYDDPELVKTFDSPEGRAPEIRRRLDDLGSSASRRWTRQESMCK